MTTKMEKFNRQSESSEWDSALHAVTWTQDQFPPIPWSQRNKPMNPMGRNTDQVTMGNGQPLCPDAIRPCKILEEDGSARTLTWEQGIISNMLYKS